MFAQTRRWFCPLFQKWRPPRRRKTPFFFLQSFFSRGSPKRVKPSFGGSRGGYLLKRKSDKGILVSIDSATNYSKHLSFIHFFFGTIGAKKKFPKRNAESPARRAPLLVESHLLKKVDENNRWVLCEHTYKSQFVIYNLN